MSKKRIDQWTIVAEVCKFLILITIGYGIGQVFRSSGVTEKPLIVEEVIHTDWDAVRSRKENKIAMALWGIESSFQLDPPDGDEGQAIGPLQIHKSYWFDATEFSGLIVTYQECRDYFSAVEVMEEYMKRYCPDAWRVMDYETIAKTHYGGPRGPWKESTEPYWQKVKSILEAMDD